MPEPMLLVPGTPLHNGKYVIDALLEDADNGALYWGTQVDTDSPIYIQAGRIQPQAQGSVEDAASDPGTPNLLASSQASSQPCCSGILETFIDSQQSYLAMATRLGLPWSQRHRYSGPLPPKQALIRVEQAATGLLWLMDQGVTAIDLSPNRVWWPDDDASVILSGWSGPLPQGDAFNPLSAMATLLWQFLSGSTLKPPDTIADLQRHHPSLSPKILQAIQFGLTASPPLEAASALTTWLQSLPMPNGHTAPIRPESEPNLPSVETPSPNDAQLAQAPSATQLGEAPATPALAQARSASPPPTTRFSPGLALALTALMAALAGVGAGMAWRFAPGAQTPGGPRFSPDQGFPTLSNWSGDSPMTPISPVRPRSRDLWEQTPESSGFPEPDFTEPGLIDPPDSLERFPDRWPTPADPWETLEGNDEAFEQAPRRDRQAPESLPPENTPQTTPSPLSGQDATLEEESQPETPSTKPPPIINPNPAETAPSSEVTPAPAPDLPTAES